MNALGSAGNTTQFCFVFKEYELISLSLSLSPQITSSEKDKMEKEVEANSLHGATPRFHGAGLGVGNAAM